MKNSILKNKNILAVSSQMDLVQSVKGRIQGTCPECRCDMVTTLGGGRQMMLMVTYNLIILDMFNTFWINLIDLAASRDFPVLALLGNSPYRKSINPQENAIIRAAVPRENLSIIVPAVEGVLKHEKMSGLRRNLEKTWRTFMKLGPGYQYPQKTSDQDFRNGEAVYIYY